MTLDPRTQLAQTMLMGVTNHNKSVTHKKPPTSHHRDRSRLEQERRSMEALTQALLDPCATVQEAMLSSLLQRAEGEPRALHIKDWSAG